MSPAISAAPILPLAAGRLLAALLASAAACLLSLLQGSSDLLSTLALAAGSLLLAVPVHMGLRLRVVAAIGGVSALSALAALQLLGGVSGLVLLLPTSLPAILLMLLWGVPDARSLAGALKVGVVGAVAASGAGSLWVWGAVADSRPAVHSAVLLACFFGPLVVAWGFAELGNRLRLRADSMAAELRDALFRALTAAGSIAMALLLAAHLEAEWASSATGTPLHSLAPLAGGLLGVSILLLAAWAVWRLPRLLAAAQGRGRADRRLPGELLLLPALGLLPALALAGDVADFGHYSLLILGSSLVYGLARWRWTRPQVAPNFPLWIVIPSPPSSALEQMASTVASHWPAGQVTLLALPEADDAFGGEHLRNATLAGEHALLTPTRPQQAADWLAAQPALWTALPLRELYAPAELWPHLLATLVSPLAHVLVLADDRSAGDDAAPAAQPAVLRSGAVWLGRLRRALNLDPVSGLLLPSARLPQLRPGLTLHELQALASGSAVGEGPLVELLKSLQPPPKALTRRLVTLLCEAAQLDEAGRIAARLDGQTDAHGQLVEAVVLPNTLSADVLLGMAFMPMRSLHHSLVLSSRLLSSSPGGGLITRLLFSLAGLLMGGARGGEFDILQLGPSAAGAPWPDAPAIYQQGLQSGALTRYIALRVSAAAADSGPVAPPRWASGEVRVPATGSPAVQAERVAMRLLALEITPLRPVDKPAAQPPPEPPPEPLAEAAPPPAAPDPALPAEPEVGVYAVASAVLVCAPGVPAAMRGDMVHSLLLVQMEATDLVPGPADWRAWQVELEAALKRQGWECESSSPEPWLEVPAEDSAADLTRRVWQTITGFPLNGDAWQYFPEALVAADLSNTGPAYPFVPDLRCGPAGRLLLCGASLVPGGGSLSATCVTLVAEPAVEDAVRSRPAVKAADRKPGPVRLRMHLHFSGWQAPPQGLASRQLEADAQRCLNRHDEPGLIRPVRMPA